MQLNNYQRDIFGTIIDQNVLLTVTTNENVTYRIKDDRRIYICKCMIKLHSQQNWFTSINYL